MDPIKGNPIGIKDCDKQVTGTIVDPTVSGAVTVKRPVTYVQPHSVDPYSTSPNAVGAIQLGNITRSTVAVPDSVIPYVANPVVSVAS